MIHLHNLTPPNSPSIPIKEKPIGLRPPMDTDGVKEISNERETDSC